MTLKPELFAHLERLGGSLTVGAFADSPSRDAVAVRHDIDYSIDVALEVAFWEMRHGVRATYYLLDTAPYWQDPRLGDKCRQLVDFGHEVGLHLNALAKWYTGRTDDVAGDIARTLDRLREGGIAIDGCAAHGDPACYEGGFINYWCLAELRPDDPAGAEDGLSAEGIAPVRARHRIAYPDDHRIVRPDGAAFPLWSVPMADLGLRYDAMHVPMDRYFTDSGGSWSRSPDPLHEDLRRGRHQILIHPIHWRAMPAATFVLSTARSASTWLAEVARQATSAHGEHEFCLNHRLEGEALVAHKRTFGDLSSLVADPAAVRDLLLQARDHIETLPDDWFEANVYLVHFLDPLAAAFPDARRVHLHRNPRDVVRSLVQRDWYDTPEDNLHPPLRAEGAASQFERICQYVAETGETLLGATETRIACERMTRDPAYLTEVFAALGIAFYPRLAAPLMGRRINAGGGADAVRVPWTPAQEAVFARICGPVATRLGYGNGTGAPDAAVPRPTPARQRRRRILAISTPAGLVARASRRLYNAARRGGIADVLPQWRKRLRLAVAGAALRDVWPVTLELIPDRHGHLVLGGGTWRALPAGAGFPIVPGRWYRGEIEIGLPRDLPNVSLYCLSYDDAGQCVHRKLVASFSRHAPRKGFAFRPRPSASRFDLALYFSAAGTARTVTVPFVRLDEVA